MNDAVILDRIRALNPSQRAYLAAQLDGIAPASPPASRSRAGELELVACIVTHNGRPIDERRLREELKRYLPDPMLPSRFVWLDELPRMPNGKIDRMALANRPAQNQPARETEHGEDAVMTTVKEIWKEVLRAESVNETDNFFEVGGHSLLAIQILSRIRTRFGIELPLRCIFDSPTVSDLSDVIRGRLGSNH